MTKYKVGEKVKVSSEGGWENNFDGIVSSEPEPVTTLKGQYDFYWITFDKPQLTIDGDDQYVKSQILSCYLSAAI